MSLNETLFSLFLLSSHFFITNVTGIRDVSASKAVCIQYKNVLRVSVSKGLHQFYVRYVWFADWDTQMADLCMD